MIDGVQKIETIVVEVVTKTIEAGGKTPESAMVGGETILLTLGGRLGRKKAERRLRRNRPPVNLAK